MGFRHAFTEELGDRLGPSALRVLIASVAVRTAIDVAAPAIVRNWPALRHHHNRNLIIRGLHDGAKLLHDALFRRSGLLRALSGRALSTGASAVRHDRIGMEARPSLPKSLAKEAAFVAASVLIGAAIEAARRERR